MFETLDSPLLLKTSLARPGSLSTWLWRLPSRFQFGRSPEKQPSSVFSFQRESDSTCHFCDLDEDEDKDDGTLISVVACPDLEKQRVGEVLAQRSDQRQIDKVGTTAISVKTRESRLSIILLDQGLLTVCKRFSPDVFSETGFSLLWPSSETFPTASERRRRLPSTTSSSSPCVGAKLFLS